MPLYSSAVLVLMWCSAGGGAVTKMFALGEVGFRCKAAELFLGGFTLFSPF